MNNIKFSIIIPNYNKEEYIDECFTSVYNQTYKNYEVIAIDDGSTDNSVEIIKKYNPDKLLFTNQVQAGGTRNAGIKVATGNYTVFLDSDDYFTNNTVLEKLANLITDEDMIFLNFTKDKFGNVEEIIEPHTPLSEKIATTNILGCPTKCFKTSLIKDITFAEGKRYEDIIFTLEAMCKTKKYTYYEDSFFTYRKVPNSNSTTPILEDTQLDILEELLKLYRLILKYPEYKDSLMKRIKGDKLPLRLDILNKLIETGINTYTDNF